ncbi:MAG: trigger factor [Clostridia bacterium]|nr:trigger factor [Clostridia bacterium]MBR0507020.1 trigger factor [Clostridia bacterium]
MAQFEKLEGNKGKLTITVDAETFRKALNEAYKKTAGRYAVQGFRKGHAPRKVIETYYGEGVFYEDAFELCWGEAYDEAVKEHDLFVVDRPDVDILSIGENEGVTYVAEVTLKPEVTLGEYKGIAVPKADYTVSDEDVQKALEAERENQARFMDVDRPAENGDRVLLDYSGSVDGEKFDGGTAEDQTLVLGSNTFIPGFEDQLVGAVAGESRDVNVTFPTEYHAEHLAGKAAVFACTVKAVQKKELPEIDDEFIGDISEFETVDAWKADKKEKMLAEKKQSLDNMRENLAIKGACDNATVDIPDCMIERQVDYMMQDIKYRLAGSGLDFNTYLKYLNTTEADMRKNYRTEAEARVKMQLVIEAISKAENVQATDEEIEEEIKKYAENGSTDVETFKAQLTDADHEYFADRIVVDKTVKLIVDAAVETEPEKAE